MKDYFDSHFADAGHEQRIEVMYPGDVLDGDQLVADSPYRAHLRDGELTHLIDEQYPDEIARKQKPEMLTPAATEELADALKAHINSQLAALGSSQFNALKFCVNVTDVSGEGSFNIHFENGSARLRRAPEPASECAIVIKAPSRILRYAMKHEFGGDAIGIGYGADFRLPDRKLAAANLDHVCYRLVTRVPTRKAYLRENPRRVVIYLIRQPPVQTWRSWRSSSARAGGANHARSVWLLRNAEELRSMFGLPEITSVGQVEIPLPLEEGWVRA
jgi:hypothetical protein